jgi:hypothetical protein
VERTWRERTEKLKRNQFITTAVLLPSLPLTWDYCLRLLDNEVVLGTIRCVNSDESEKELWQGHSRLKPSEKTSCLYRVSDSQ